MCACVCDNVHTTKERERRDETSASQNSWHWEISRWSSTKTTFLKTSTPKHTNPNTTSDIDTTTHDRIAQQDGPSVGRCRIWLYGNECVYVNGQWEKTRRNAPLNKHYHHRRRRQTTFWYMYSVHCTLYTQTQTTDTVCVPVGQGAFTTTTSVENERDLCFFFGAKQCCCVCGTAKTDKCEPSLCVTQPHSIFWDTDKLDILMCVFDQYICKIIFRLWRLHTALVNVSGYDPALWPLLSVRSKSG